MIYMFTNAMMTPEKPFIKHNLRNYSAFSVGLLLQTIMNAKFCMPIF